MSTVLATGRCTPCTPCTLSRKFPGNEFTYAREGHIVRPTNGEQLTDALDETSARLTTTGLVQRFVTDWAGPRALVRGVSIRLGVPA